MVEDTEGAIMITTKVNTQIEVYPATTHLDATDVA